MGSSSKGNKHYHFHKCWGERDKSQIERDKNFFPLLLSPRGSWEPVSRQSGNDQSTHVERGDVTPETLRETEAIEREDPCGRDQSIVQDPTIFSAL